MGVTIFCALFGAVYEIFSHGVYSFGMIYAFAFPLLLGVVPFTIMAMLRRRAPESILTGVYHAGVACLTVGSIMSGVLEIYGTTNRLLFIYYLAGAAMVLLSAAAHLVSIVRK